MAPNRRTQDRSAKSLAKLRIALAKRNEKNNATPASPDGWRQSRLRAAPIQKRSGWC